MDEENIIEDDAELTLNKMEEEMMMVIVFDEGNWLWKGSRMVIDLDVGNCNW